MAIDNEVESLTNFKFIALGVMADGDLTLQLLETSPYNPANGYVPAYKFAMISAKTGVTMGAIDLRVCLTERLEKYR